MLTLRLMVLLVIAVLVGVGAGWLTIASGKPWAAGVLAGVGAAAAALVYADKIVQ
jgi:F0F1-type ATP synthase assembly protein I